MGLPCSHYLSLAVYLAVDNLPISAFDGRWVSERTIHLCSVASSVDTDDTALPESVLSAQDLQGTYADTQRSHNVRMEELKEIHRLFGDHLQPWIDACLSVKRIIDFPLPVVENNLSELDDPAAGGGRNGKGSKVRMNTQKLPRWPSL